MKNPGIASHAADLLLASSQIPRIQNLHLAFTAGRKYPPAGIEAFRRARPDVRVEVDEVVYEPYAPLP